MFSAGVAMIFMLSIFFSFSFGPVSWVLASEVFPTSTRSIGTSVATCSNWVCHSELVRYLKAQLEQAFNTFIGQVSPIALQNVGWRFYMLFICLNFVDFIAIFFFFPETKGLLIRSLGPEKRDISNNG